MSVTTARKRIPAEERREMLISVARKLFAERGLDGTKTSQIAAEAGVSEALLYRHFSSKDALYREVLRQTLREQDAMYDVLGVPEASAESLITVIREYLRVAIATPKGALREGSRIMLASLAGDGNYAAQVYRRAMRKQIAPITAALESAAAAGELEGHRLTPESVAMLVEHVGSLLAAGVSLPGRDTLYPHDRERLLDDATWFCCRGIGLTAASIERCLSGKVIPLGRARLGNRKSN
ncbi:TetR/AcrR family transcriptional regulator [Parafrankia sp. BMG5.11]|uniref:TetR/AcrR family transcriptional regulator n=1 Tax=Parafrankia sp. BMG5.11 TaxID=222540 RepID=UPI0014051DD2|nr:TetR/AcrR family transcriptional regulator [Parafrankia sp. BMG5.11]